MTLTLAPPDLTITVTNHRPAPQGSKKYAGHRANKTTGKSSAVLIEQSKRVKPWRVAVTDAARTALEELPIVRHLDAPPLFTGAVAVEITFTVRKPASAPKHVTWPVTRDSGDLDKLQRATFDAISDAGGIWVDDSRVVQVTATKVHPGEGVDALDQPGAIIRIWDLVAAR